MQCTLVMMLGTSHYLPQTVLLLRVRALVWTNATSRPQTLQVPCLAKRANVSRQSESIGWVEVEDWNSRKGLGKLTKTCSLCKTLGWPRWR